MARMTWDGIRAVDFLVSLPNVDPARIGGLGHSLGAKEVLYAAAFDERYRAVVFSEGGIGLGYSNWQAVWYLGEKIRAPGFPLEHHQLMALIAPRGFLLLAGESADGARSGAFVDAARPVYALFGAEKNLAWLNHGAGHRYPANARQTAEAFLDAQLQR
jgi:dienelactone hydrolase